MNEMNNALYYRPMQTMSRCGASVVGFRRFCWLWPLRWMMLVTAGVV